jgi:hypothetical protein
MLKIRKSLSAIGEKVAYFAIAALIILVILGVMFRGMLVSESVAKNAAETQGFTQVEVTDRAIFFVAQRGCSKSDSVRFTVKAVNPAGKRVKFYVCSGWIFKGATIRHK